MSGEWTHFNSSSAKGFSLLFATELTFPNMEEPGTLDNRI